MPFPYTKIVTFPSMINTNCSWWAFQSIPVKMQLCETCPAKFSPPLKIVIELNSNIFVERTFPLRRHTFVLL